MRDERWVDRFLYAWNKSPWFDPIDLYYMPKGLDYLPKDPSQRITFERHGLWWGHGDLTDLPQQGWKIHISASLRCAPEVAERSMTYLLARDHTFKVVLDQNVYGLLNSKASTRGGSGKLLTIYPRSIAEFKQLLRDLSELLDGLEGPYVLSDMRYKNSRCVYFRYGQFKNTYTVDVLGRRIPHIMGPTGIEPDLREPGAYRPIWEPWPFDDWDEPQPTESLDLCDGRFTVTSAIQFSNSGGVYNAIDHQSGDEVVLKEARPFTNPDLSSELDATGCLDREWQFLGLLASTNRYPQPVANFTEWEHEFIAESFTSGIDIREIFFELNPLVKPHAWTVDESASFLRAYCKIFISFMDALSSAHERGIIIGDVSAKNILVDPDTYEVSLVDLEAARLIEPDGTEGHLAETVPLYTPGFVTANRDDRASGFSDDLFGLAAIMGYLIFPISVMTFLRPATLGLFRGLVKDLGWPIGIADVIEGLANDSITLGEARSTLGRLEASKAVSVREASATGHDRDPAKRSFAYAQVTTELELGVRTAADLERFSLFPVDPFAHVTNGLGLGFGAAGILYSFARCGREIPTEWSTWLSDRCEQTASAELPAGLLTGQSGLAWALKAIGDDDGAAKHMHDANRRAPDVDDFTVYYGLGGLGLANLRMFASTHDQRWLDEARELGSELRRRAEEDEFGPCWSNAFSGDQTLTGFGLGQAGLALYFLRLAQATGDDEVLAFSRDVVDAEIARGVQWKEVLTFDHRGTAEPYIEVGAAGIAQVVARFDDAPGLQPVVDSLFFDHAVLPGYVFGMAGVAESLIDIGYLREEPRLITQGHRQLDYIQSVFLFRGDERGVHSSTTRSTSLLVPGEGLMRASADFATGAAGVMRVFHRAGNHDDNDWYLDDCQF